MVIVKAQTVYKIKLKVSGTQFLVLQQRTNRIALLAYIKAIFNKEIDGLDSVVLDLL